MPPIENLIFEFTSFGLGLYVLYNLWKDPNKFHLLGFLLTVVTAAAVELSGVRETHSYYYGEFVIYIQSLSPMILAFFHDTGRDVPLFVAVDWAIIFYCFWRLGERLNLQWYLIPLVFGFIAVLLDLGLDPIASASRQVLETNDACVDLTLAPGPAEGVGYWVWCIGPTPPEYWHWVPLPNFYGWFLVVAVFAFFYGWAHKKAYALPIGTQFTTLLKAMAASLAIFFTLLNWLLLIDLGAPGWWLLGGLMVAGVVALVMAGVNRPTYTIDWRSLMAVGTIILLSVGTYLLRLQGHPDLIVPCGLALISSLVVTWWVMRGRHFFG